MTAVENCLLALETVGNQSLRDVLRGKRSELEAKRRELERAAGGEDLSSRMVDAIRDCVERSSGLLGGMETGLDSVSEASLAQKRSTIEGFAHEGVVEALGEVTKLADSLAGSIQDVYELHNAVVQMALWCGGAEVRRDP